MGIFVDPPYSKVVQEITLDRPILDVQLVGNGETRRVVAASVALDGVASVDTVFLGSGKHGTPRPIGRLQAGDPVQSMTLTRDGKGVALLHGSDEPILQYYVLNPKRTQLLPVPDRMFLFNGIIYSGILVGGIATGVAFSPDGQVLGATGWWLSKSEEEESHGVIQQVGRGLRQVGIKGDVLTHFREDFPIEQYPTCIAISRGRATAIGTNADSVLLDHMVSGRELITQLEFPSISHTSTKERASEVPRITDVKFFKDRKGTILVAGSTNGLVCAWRLSQQAGTTDLVFRGEIESKPVPVTSVGVSREGYIIATAGDETSSLRVWSMKSPSEPIHTESFPGKVTALRIPSYGKKQIALAINYQTVQVREVSR